MPGAKCCINGCTSRYYNNKNGILMKSSTSFFRFPKSEEIKRKWLSNIKMFNKQDLHLGSDTRICGEHFDENKNPVYFPLMTSRCSTQQLEYLTDIDEEVDSNKENNYSKNINIQPVKPAISTIRYPGDIKDQSHNVKILKEALENKNKRILQLKVENQQLKKKCNKYEYQLGQVNKVLDSLVKKKYLGAEMVNMIKKMIENPQLVEYLSNSFKKKSPELFQKIASNVGEYSDEIKKFALTLSFYSRRAYNFVRHSFNNYLPHIRTISRWLEKVDGSPGFTRSAIPIIKKKIEDAAFIGKKLKFSLQVDGMHLRSKYTVNRAGQTDGNEDFGNLNKKFKESRSTVGNEDEDDDMDSIAKESWTFLINCVNDRWKMPVAYFFIHKLDASDQAFLIEEVIYFLEANGIDILTLTFDGTKTNLACVRKLGACLDIDNLKPFFYSFFGTKIFVILDACHMIKLVRNNFWGRKQLIDRNGDKIHWTYLPTLNNIQEKEKLHLGNRVTKRHINFHKSKMKVNLAVQLLSSSVATSLRFLSKDETYKRKFKNVNPTADFIEIINNLFDILNSRKMDGKIYCQAMKPENYEFISNYFDRCTSYIKGLQVKKRQQSKKKNNKHRIKSDMRCTFQTRNGQKFKSSPAKKNKNYHESDKDENDPLATFEDCNIQQRKKKYNKRRIKQTACRGRLKKPRTETTDEVSDEESMEIESICESECSGDANVDPLANSESEVDDNTDDQNWEDMYEDKVYLQPGFEMVLESNVRTGFLGLLVNMETFKQLFEEQVLQQKNLQFIYTYKFSQDHLETFFSSIRAHGGFNDNPSPSQFKDAYRKLIMNKGVSVSTGNCKLEEIICNETFNDFDTRNDYEVDDFEFKSHDYFEEHNFPTFDLNMEHNEYKSNVIAYIAGFIKFKLLKTIDCTSCIQFLNEDEVECELIRMKSWGQLTKPNENLIRLCKVADSAFKQISRFNQEHIKTFAVNCIRSIQSNNLYYAMPPCNVERINDHNFFFMKNIFEMFLKIRLNHVAKLDTLNAAKDFIRNQCKKMPQFKNQ